MHTRSLCKRACHHLPTRFPEGCCSERYSLPREEITKQDMYFVLHIPTLANMCRYAGLDRLVWKHGHGLHAMEHGHVLPARITFISEALCQGPVRAVEQDFFILSTPTPAALLPVLPIPCHCYYCYLLMYAGASALPCYCYCCLSCRSLLAYDLPRIRTA